MYDKKGNSTVSSDNLGDLLRGLGQNPTQAEVRELIKSLGGSDKHGKSHLNYQRVFYLPRAIELTYHPHGRR
jgi:Ca2+-binding EF-hand superfamily protein